MRLSLGAVLSMFLVSAAAMPSAGDRNKHAPMQMESVMTTRLDGWIVIDPTGNLTDFGIETVVPKSLHDGLERTVRQWRFQPVEIDGQPRSVRARMRLTLAARPMGDRQEIRVDNVLFPGGDDQEARKSADTDSAILAVKQLTPPKYPANLQMAGVSGIVMLAIRIGRDGKAEEVASTQTVLLDVKGSENVLRQAAKMMEQSALLAARQWTFDVQPKREVLSPSDMTVTIPVHYMLGSGKGGRKTYGGDVTAGTWRIEVRGERRSIPWISSELPQQVAGASDLQSGEMFPLASRIRFAERGIGDAVL